MGTAVQAKGVDASAWASELILPGSLADGLKGAWLFRGTMENSLINMAPDGIQGARAVGTPVISADGKYAVLKSSTHFIQTELDEDPECSVGLLFRAPTATPPTQSPTLAPILFGNYTTTGNPGIVTWCPSRDGVAMNAGRIVDGIPANSGVTLAETSPATYNTWHATLGRVGILTNSVDDFTSNKRIDQGNGNARSGMQANKLRIGSGYSAAQTGDVHMAAAFYWNRRLTTAETTAFGKWLLAYQSLIGIAN